MTQTIKKHICAGLLAHVDAGKTTLSEALLYTSGQLRQLGRVDHQDAFLDFDEQERKRGITIYAKEGELRYGNLHVNFVDTPGHVDFTSEMERALQVIDYAILIVSGVDGVQAHTKTIWKLLEAYQIPTFIFVNKMDIAYDDKEHRLANLQQELDSRCLDFTLHQDALMEEVSMCDEGLMETYLQTNNVAEEDIAYAICQRHIFPVYFGSALKLEGIQALLEGLQTYTLPVDYPETFGAKIYKISHDENGNRLAHVKVTGGVLKAKMKLDEDEKVDQLRRYHGMKYEVIQEAKAGELCVIKGLKNLQAQQGLGFEQHQEQPLTSPVMNYRMVLPKHVDPFDMMRKLQPIIEEDPRLHVAYDEEKKEIRVQLMGEVQMEILKYKILQLLNIPIDFDEGKINYKETILKEVEGVGHFEPLRHYAEVHILLEPLPLGSGIVIESEANTDQLDKHWQRLVLAHLAQKEHVGVLLGAPLTDVKMTLLCGKAHLKHTDAGDFRQACYRAIRQALMKSESVVLEPIYQFQLTIPTSSMSRVIYDLQRMAATVKIVEQNDATTMLEGSASVAKMQSYPLELRAITKGKGKLTCALAGYQQSAESEALSIASGYDPERDLRNPSSSVFCIHGSGVIIPWNQVEEYMHLPLRQQAPISSSTMKHRVSKVDDAELQRVFESIYGRPKPKTFQKPKVKRTNEVSNVEIASVKILPECLLVDGYNMIYGWDELKHLANDHMDAARDRLIDLLNSYQGYKKCEVIVVFDAYKRDHQTITTSMAGKVHVVYTKKSQTADSYIEAATHKLAKDYRVRVATSDGLEQLIVIGQGATRISARELESELSFCSKTTLKEYQKNQPVFRNQALADIKNYKK